MKKKPEFENAKNIGANVWELRHHELENFLSEVEDAKIRVLSVATGANSDWLHVCLDL